MAKRRARDLGIPFEGNPGRNGAVTDVAGVEVGFATIVKGRGRRGGRRGPARTGVTVVFPRGRASRDSVMAGAAVLNGNGEMTGMAWVEEGGFLDGPIAITNTHSVGVVRDAIIDWQGRRRRVPRVNQVTSELYFTLPVVAETADGRLNDMNAFHVKPAHVFRALDGARGGPVAEGNVGGGTGMICHGWKGGTGTASRVTAAGHTVGVLVQANHGRAALLTVAGVPLGAELRPPPAVIPGLPEGAGSIIAVVATDAPLLPHQLRRIARRVSLGVGRTGGLGENSSGDLFIAFSTANPEVAAAEGVARIDALPNRAIDPLFEATVQATEEAIVNAMVAAETMTGADGITVEAIPHRAIRRVLRRHGRLTAR
jgi:D-aminopeptidase